MHSIYHDKEHEDVGLKGNETNKINVALERLDARGMIEIDNRQEDHRITLNEKPHEGHSKLSLLAEKIIAIVNKHFVIDKDEIHKKMGQGSKHWIGKTTTYLINRGILKKTGEDERIVGDNPVPVGETVEAKKIIEELHKNNHTTWDKAYKLLGTDSNEAISMLNLMEKEGMLSSAYSEKYQTTVYFLPSGSYTDSKEEEEELITDVITSRQLPVQYELISNEINVSVGGDFLNKVIKEMLEEGKLKREILKFRYAMFALPGMDFKNEEYYSNELVNFVKSQGVISEKDAIEFMKTRGVYSNVVQDIIMVVAKETAGLIKVKYDYSLGSRVLSDPNISVDTGKILVAKAAKNALRQLNTPLISWTKLRSVLSSVTSIASSTYYTALLSLKGSGLLSVEQGPESEYYVASRNFDITGYFENMLLQYIKANGGLEGDVPVAQWDQYLHDRGMKGDIYPFIKKMVNEKKIFTSGGYYAHTMTLKPPPT